MALRELIFPLVPRRRLVGLAFGAMHSARRGMGTDVAGSRPYLPGDDVDMIDWGASARLSTARGGDEFIVRENYAEEAPRVVIVCDRRPEMLLYPPDLPWLHKREAMSIAAEIIAESAARARGFVGYLDHGHSADEPFWRPPKSHAENWAIRERHLLWPEFNAPPNTVALALDFLADHRRAVPAGSFVFVLSDFLEPVPLESWTRALEFRWDVVPVVIQDPVWEQSFPDVGSVVVPLADAAGRIRLVRLRADEVQARRRSHEERRERLHAEVEGLGIEAISIASTDRDEIFRAFLAWADEREFRRGRGL